MVAWKLYCDVFVWTTQLSDKHMSQDILNLLVYCLPAKYGFNVEKISFVNSSA